MTRNQYWSTNRRSHCTPDCCNCPCNVRTHLPTCSAGAGNVDTFCYNPNHVEEDDTVSTTGEFHVGTALVRFQVISYNGNGRRNVVGHVDNWKWSGLGVPEGTDIRLAISDWLDYAAQGESLSDGAVFSPEIDAWAVDNQDAIQAWRDDNCPEPSCFDRG